MKVAFNALSAKAGSGPTFFRRLLPSLAGHSQHEYCILIAPEQKELKALIPEGLETQVIRGVPRGFAARVAWEQAFLPSLLKRWRVDVLYSTGNVTCLATSVPTVVAITTANPFSPLHLSWSRAMRLKLQTLRIATSLSARRSSMTIFLSENSRALLSHRLGVPPERTAVIPYGWAPFASGYPPPLDHPYLLTVSGLAPYRNLERLMRAFDLMVAETKFDGELVIAGAAASTQYLRQLLSLRAALTYGERVRLTGRTSQTILEALYEHALGFAFPSLEETLGVPLQEAMGAGIPVVAGDARLGGITDYFNPSREVCGEAAIYFDPFDLADMAGTLSRLVTDDGLRSHLSELGRRRVRLFSLERMARDTVAVLEDAAARGKSETSLLGNSGD